MWVLLLTLISQTTHAALDSYIIGAKLHMGDALGSQGSSSSQTSGRSSQTYESQIAGSISQGFAQQNTHNWEARYYLDNIKQSQRVIDDMQSKLADPMRFAQYQEKAAVSTNTKINYDYGVLIDPSEIADVEPLYELQSFGEFRSTLEPTLQILSKIGPLRTPQYIARDFGLESVKLADRSFVAGDHDDAEFYRDLAQGFTELALGLHPATGLAQSSYELIRGKSFFGGHELSVFQRGVAFAGILSFGQVRNALKLGTLLGRITAHASKSAHISHAVEAGIKFLKTSAGKVFSLVKTEGRIAEDASYMFFERKASVALNFPKNHEYIRILPRSVAEEVKAGLKPLSRRTESFISTADDVKGFKDPAKLAERLGLYDDEAGKILHKLTYEEDVVMKFKIDREVLAEYETVMQSEYNMFLAGAGETIGGAREYIVKPDLLTQLLKDGKIKIEEIKIINIGDL